MDTIQTDKIKIIRRLNAQTDPVESQVAQFTQILKRECAWIGLQTDFDIIRQVKYRGNLLDQPFVTFHGQERRGSPTKVYCVNGQSILGSYAYANFLD